jgi:hypothetical protein
LRLLAIVLPHGDAEVDGFLRENGLLDLIFDCIASTESQVDRTLVLGVVAALAGRLTSGGIDGYLKRVIEMLAEILNADPQQCEVAMTLRALLDHPGVGEFVADRVSHRGLLARIPCEFVVMQLAAGIVQRRPELTLDIVPVLEGIPNDTGLAMMIHAIVVAADVVGVELLAARLDRDCLWRESVRLADGVQALWESAVSKWGADMARGVTRGPRGRLVAALSSLELLERTGCDQPWLPDASLIWAVVDADVQGAWAGYAFRRLTRDPLAYMEGVRD